MEDRGAQDQRLVRAVLEGDREAFGELVRRHQRMAAGIAWRYGVPASELEDVVSEILFKAWTNLERYRPEHPFSTWFYRIAANHVVDHGRRARRERGRTDLPEQLDDGRPGPAAEVESDERARLVRAALAATPARYREVLFLVHVEGIKVEETARMLGLPEGTVKSRLKRGRDALRKVLVRSHPEHFGGTDGLS